MNDTLKPEELQAGLRSYFGNMQVDQDSVASTLGQRYGNVTPEAMLQASKKVLAVHRGEAETDDRDSLEFQTVHDYGDFLADKIRNDQNGTMRKHLWKVTGKNGDLDVIPAAPLDAHARHLINEAGLANLTEQINPLDMWNQQFRIVRLGEGALPSVESVPEEARSVQPSYMNFVDPVISTENQRIGVDIQLAQGVRKGKDNLLYKRFINLKTGKPVWVSHREAAKSVIMFPDSVENDAGMVPALVRGRDIQWVPRDQAQFVPESSQDLFTPLGDTVPLNSAIKGMRYQMGGKFVKATLPLVDREAPFVDAQTPDGPASRKFGRLLGAKYSGVEGTVSKVTPDYIEIIDARGNRTKTEIYRDVPLARKTALNSVPVVREGQRVRAGDLLAGTNYTDASGNMALGRNIRIAYMNARGGNFEDAIVISRSAAEKFRSEHMYSDSFDNESGVSLDRERYRMLFPGRFTREQMGTIAENGIVKPGTVLRRGDPMMLIVRDRLEGAGLMGRQRVGGDARTWTHHDAGIVTDVVPTKSGWQVYVKTQSPLGIGDKLAASSGLKGIVSQILDDTQMPVAADGKPVEMLLSAKGVPSRANPAIVINALLGKIAERTGKRYTLPGFTTDSLVDFTKSELEKNGMTDREDLIDPPTGRVIPQVTTGNLYIYKLQHMAEGKAKAEATGAYTLDEEPTKSADDASIAKHIGEMELASYLSHGAEDVLKDAKLIRGQGGPRMDEFWRRTKLGQTPALPGTPLVYSKFRDLIQAAGVRLSHGSRGDHIFAMTDQQARELTGDSRLQNADTYLADSLQPVPGGLFDPKLTASDTDGRRWAYMALPEPMLNPVMEAPMRSLLGMTQKELNAVVSGEVPINDLRGGEALKYLLSRINLGAVIDNAKRTLREGSPSKKDAAIKQIRYAEAMRRENVRPEDYMMTRVPVLPPRFRPIVRQGDRTAVNDLNYMYRALHDTIKDFDESKDLPANLRQQSRLDVYNTYKALIGTGDPVQEKLEQRQIGGVLASLFGKNSPKYSFTSRRVIGSNMNVSGLSTITLNPSLKLNQIGIPEERAYDLAEPFIIRKLVQKNFPAVTAVKMVQDHSPEAREALLQVLKERPIIFNRAPTLHKFNTMAAEGVLTPGHTVQIPPTIMGPSGTDVDGDTYSYTMPVTDAAVRQARAKMMPERNLFSPRTGKPVYVPTQDYTEGLWLATKAPRKGPARNFPTREAAVQAYRRGEIAIDSPVTIG